MNKLFLLLTSSLIVCSLTAAEDPVRTVRRVDYTRDKNKLEYVLYNLNMRAELRDFLEQHQYSHNKKHEWLKHKENSLIPMAHDFFVNHGIERKDAHGNYVLRRNVVIALQKFRPKVNHQQNDLLAKYYAFWKSVEQAEVIYD